MITAVCQCGVTNTKTDMRIVGYRCEHCRSYIAVDQWKNEDGSLAKDNDLELECQHCGQKFIGKYWATHCKDCYKKLRLWEKRDD